MKLQVKYTLTMPDRKPIEVILNMQASIHLTPQLEDTGQPHQIPPSLGIARESLSPTGGVTAYLGSGDAFFIWYHLTVTGLPSGYELAPEQPLMATKVFYGSGGGDETAALPNAISGQKEDPDQRSLELKVGSGQNFVYTIPGQKNSWIDGMMMGEKYPFANLSVAEFEVLKAVEKTEWLTYESQAGGGI